MEILAHHEVRSSQKLTLQQGPDLDALITQLPEQELWRLLEDVTALEIELKDDTIVNLDDRMQGFLFLQEYVRNRAARIEFARSPVHMPYLRDAAGSRNVCMDDEEFSELVSEDDSATLACFARCEQMLPHHLLYIEYKLAIHPHRQELLATSYDAMITLMKVLESQGSTREISLMRVAKAVLEGSTDLERIVANCAFSKVECFNGDPRALWRGYLNLKTLDEPLIRELLQSCGLSTSRPLRTSVPGNRLIQ